MNLRRLIESKKILMFDGAMGTQLEIKGAQVGPISNIESPEIVEAIHREYVAAGAEFIITNTFTMNKVYVNSHGIDFDYLECNRKGVELALKASENKAFVLGGLGPTGQLLEPYGTLTEKEAYDAYLEQAKTLASAGVNGLIFETMTDVNELLAGVKACKDNLELPVFASLTYLSGADSGRTPMGNKASDCAAALEKAGADVIGINCGTIEPSIYALIVKTYKSVSNLPVLIEPNAGSPRLEKDETVYDMPPDEFITTIKSCIDAGATLAGGCCGTTPGHIKAVADYLCSIKK